jgi:hypothetical protein
MLDLKMSGARDDFRIPEYLDGEPPEALSAGELTMDGSEGLEED